MRQQPPNARLWIWWNQGWVKITVRPGLCVDLQTGGPTDEGWNYENESWTNCGQGVLHRWKSEGQDCDGRLDSGGESYCPLEDLAARDMEIEGSEYTDNRGIFAPAWQTAQHGWRRDYAAEAAGY